MAAPEGVLRSSQQQLRDARAPAAGRSGGNPGRGFLVPQGGRHAYLFTELLADVGPERRRGRRGSRGRRRARAADRAAPAGSGRADALADGIRPKQDALADGIRPKQDALADGLRPVQADGMADDCPADDRSALALADAWPTTR